MSVEPTPIYERQHREEIDINWGLIGFIAVVLLLEAAGLTIWHPWVPIVGFFVWLGAWIVRIGEFCFGALLLVAVIYVGKIIYDFIDDHWY